MIVSAGNQNPKQPVFLCLPAMGVPARKYLPLAENLNAEGVATALFEWRGLGSSNLRASRKVNFGYNHILSDDLPVAIKQVREDFPQNPMYILGHSLGGQLGLLALCQYPDEFEGMVGVATGTPYFKGWQFPSNLGLFISSKLMRWIAAAIGHFPGRKLGFAGREARQVIRDWSRSVSSGEYRVEGNPHEFETLCHQLKKRALLITIDDDILAPPKSAQNLGKKLSASEVTYMHLGKGDFPSGKTGHFNWMQDPLPVVEQILKWNSD
ncbi:alpha/beta fold hydrolase [Aliikangiella sp. G2MR2-5]|uniref:alpha/beta fold hydrolase n=1 Tax=Aliikangiella sp. G2MR2-5 TaxID=2788943 RepID=UPI0018AAE3D2|nr:alpha/beta fold hydrolase [Aliikangiella sp. G2MR2-5]